MAADGQPKFAFGTEARLALNLARTSLLSHPGDTRRAARMVQSSLGWSFERALWFIEVNSEHLPNGASADPDRSGRGPSGRSDLRRAT